ncbi:MAG: hypothetical protein LBP50_06180 [Tannerella sp.]|jgi:hypothetical protein|nr:hypothetical protein [Tannerella sp.]
METTFLFDMICLMAGISAVCRLIGRLPESSADIRMPDGDRSVSGQLLPDANEPVIQPIFRPTARNGIQRRLPNRKAGAAINNNFPITD